MSKRIFQTMSREDLEDEVMLLRAKVKVMGNEAHVSLHNYQKKLAEKDNEVLSLRQQLAALTCSCCDPDPNDTYYHDQVTRQWD